MAIKSFKDRGTEDINLGSNTRAARGVLPRQLHGRTQVKLARLNAAESLHDLTSLLGNRFEHLKGNRSGQCSIRINDQYRLCFVWQGSHAYDVEIVDYH